MAVFGVYCCRFGVPLIDGGTVRLPRLIGESRALDLILTGRAVAADEALARQIAAFPQRCMRNDRASVLAQHGLPLHDALAQEFVLGMQTLRSGESVSGARSFAGGAGRHGSFDKDETPPA